MLTSKDDDTKVQRDEVSFSGSSNHFQILEAFFYICLIINHNNRRQVHAHLYGFFIRIFAAFLDWYLLKNLSLPHLESHCKMSSSSWTNKLIDIIFIQLPEWVFQKQDSHQCNLNQLLTCREKQAGLIHCSELGNVLSSSNHAKLKQICELVYLSAARQDLASQQPLYIWIENKKALNIDHSFHLNHN